MTEKAILLVEDNPSDIALTRRAFDKSRIANELIVAEDGQEALDFFTGGGKFSGRDTTELPAVILLDLKLPRVSGLDVLKWIRSREETHRIPVVVLTTSKEEKDVGASYDNGVNSYIRKPIGFESFVECIKGLGLYWLIINEPPPRP